MRQLMQKKKQLSINKNLKFNHDITRLGSNRKGRSVSLTAVLVVMLLSVSFLSLTSEQSFFASAIPVSNEAALKDAITSAPAGVSTTIAIDCDIELTSTLTIGAVRLLCWKVILMLCLSGLSFSN
jgi:hypothetical protein